MGIQAVFFVATRPLIDNKALVVHKIQYVRSVTEPHRLQTKFMSWLPKEYGAEWNNLVRSESATASYPYDTKENANLKYFMNYCLPNDIVESFLDERLAIEGISEKNLISTLYMTDNDIRKLHKKGHKIGGHTHQHIALTKMSSDSEIDQDLRESNNYLQQITGQGKMWFSYPFGRSWAIPMNPDQLCIRNGYSLGFTLNSGWNRNNCSPYCLNRINHNECEILI